MEDIQKTKGTFKSLRNFLRCFGVDEELVKSENELLMSRKKAINSEIKSAEEEIIELKKQSPNKINQIAIDTSADLIRHLIGAEVNKSNISAIVEDLSKKEKDKSYGI